LVLQHPDEAKHPLNTARLAVLGLQNAQMLVGECFPQLDQLLAQAHSAFLLFPKKEEKALRAAGPAFGQAGPCPAEALPGSPSAAKLLVVPDGTWRNARKIVNANPALQALPRLGLPIAEPSEYKVRKAREPGALSTIEAIVRALSVLEPEGDFQPLLKSFNVLVQQQIEAMGPEVYRRNY